MNTGDLPEPTTERNRLGSKKVLLVCAGGSVLVGIVLALIVFQLSKSREVPNAKVTTVSYDLLKNGATISDVEAILGKGRQPNPADFDAIFGSKQEGFAILYSGVRSAWEEKNQRGLVLIWTNVNDRLLIAFHQHPDHGGRVLSKMFKSVSSYMSQESNVFEVLPNSPESKPKPTQKPSPNPNADPAEWEKLIGTWEVEGEPRLRIRFGADMKIGDIFMHEGRQIREKIFNVLEVKNENGRMAPQIDLNAGKGKSSISAVMGIFWFKDGTLYRDTGNFDPIKKLLRVNN